jgi:D-tyrosyl-tRNA(Tyr) deacylase
MRALIQRVAHAKVEIEGQVSGEIGKGLLVLLGITHSDAQKDVDWLVNKLCKLRIFTDQEGKMNLSVEDIGGDMLVVSQFTLHADTRKGTRPSYVKAARPEQAIPLYEQFLSQLSTTFSGKVASGEFGAKMAVSLLNDGPVTIMLDTEN